MLRTCNAFFLAAVLLVGCDSTQAPRPSASPTTAAGGIDDIHDVRLDVYPDQGDDFLGRMPVAAATYQDRTVEEVAGDLAKQGKFPVAFYGEGIESQHVTLSIPARASMRQAISLLASAAGCHYAYYLNLHAQTVTGGVKLTRRPYKSYADGELGALYLVYP